MLYPQYGFIEARHHRYALPVEVVDEIAGFFVNAHRSDIQIFIVVYMIDDRASKDRSSFIVRCFVDA